MKLPRWLVIAMLTSSVLALLAAAGWWWVTWPERTVLETVESDIYSYFELHKRTSGPQVPILKPS